MTAELSAVVLPARYTSVHVAAYPTFSEPVLSRHQHDMIAMGKVDE